MKADVQYNDLRGTASADVSDLMAHFGGDDLSSFANYFKLDKERFDIVGVSFYGTGGFSASLLCVDKQKSTPEKEHIVSLGLGTRDDDKILNTLFKRLHVVLHNFSDEKYSDPNLNYSEEAHFSDYHEVEEEEDGEDQN
ncbi:MAG: hypothetical protein EOO50_05185 [Flavobacterium sp.]|uniref:hypothetical protein n=1 Tax=Flavobacterium sp. TaxID=239 RepID=UPI001219D18A|nr:hypothetical protein [Flavobacterium sp.]RZJ67677.1 MAG: hypothetical protein EOO50_05185 [Flavobacterium sp.]